MPDRYPPDGFRTIGVHLLATNHASLPRTLYADVWASGWTHGMDMVDAYRALSASAVILGRVTTSDGYLYPRDTDPATLIHWYSQDGITPIWAPPEASIMVTLVEDIPTKASPSMVTLGAAERPEGLTSSAYDQNWMPLSGTVDVPVDPTMQQSPFASKRFPPGVSVGARWSHGPLEVSVTSVSEKKDNCDISDDGGWSAYISYMAVNNGGYSEPLRIGFSLYGTSPQAYVPTDADADAPMAGATEEQQIPPGAEKSFETQVRLSYSHGGCSMLARPKLFGYPWHLLAFAAPTDAEPSTTWTTYDIAG